MTSAVDTPINLFTLSRADLEAYAKDAGQPAFRGRQLFRWMYGKGARSFEEMTDLPKAFRAHLEQHATIKGLELDHIKFATDRTIKCLFKLPSGLKVESVLIPDFDADKNPKRLTVCVSSQVGCAMGCSFCATGLMGFKQNLNAAEIFDQVWQLNTLAMEHFGRPVTNIVYMGMGEPMQNYDSVLLSTVFLSDEEGMGLSPKRITVSTVGLARRIKQLADQSTRFNLAVSLHAPTDEKRSSIMPVNRNERTDITGLMDSLKYYTKKTGRRITFEYCMFYEFNDTIEDAKHLAALALQIPSKVNLIMYNQVADVPFRKTSENRLNNFIQVLTKRDVLVTVRRSRGQDIDAACGQLLVNQASPPRKDTIYRVPTPCPHTVSPRVPTPKQPQAKQQKTVKSQNTLEKILLGGIGSFILVLLFPRGVKYFFKHIFAEMVQAIVTIVLAALLTQKLAERVTQNSKTPELPDA